jgi:hypothetical protein
MDRRTPERELDEISALVREEKNAALAAFRSRDFRSLVMRRWREGAGPSPGRRPNVRPAMVAAAAAGLLIVAAALFFLVRQAPGPGRRPAFQTLASVLGSLPGGVTLSREETAAPAASGLSDPSALAVSVRSALGAGQRTGETDRALEDPPGRALPTTPTSLYRKMEILFKDRVIERTLLSLKDPSKEV